MLAQVVTPNIEWSLIWPFTILSMASIILITITSLVPSTRKGSFPAAFTAASAITAALSARARQAPKCKGASGPTIPRPA